MTQSEMILNHLQAGRTITPLEAQEMFGCMRLGARIWDLKHQGHRIVSEREEGVNKFGVQCHWARYRMVNRA